MLKVPALTATMLIFLATACTGSAGSETAVASSSCSAATLEAIAQKVPTGDGRGHGPDRGSDEWYSVVEFRLGVRGAPGVPERGTRAWCDFVLNQAN